MPIELAKDIDALVGPRSRSAFLVELAEKEIRRRKLLIFLERGQPAWREEDHPDIAEEGAVGSGFTICAVREPQQAHLDELGAENAISDEIRPQGQSCWIPLS